ncbi:MAG: histidine kinase [Thermoanaerobaculia bacterium]|nr:histidine kinase [Thermoanaerobaculia bacterium]
MTSSDPTQPMEASPAAQSSADRSPMERARRLSAELGVDTASGTSRRSASHRWSLYLLGWTGVGLLFSMPILVSSLVDKTLVPWSMVSSEMLRWYLWALLVPIMWWQARRFPLERGPGVRVATHLAINLVLAVVVSFFYSILDVLKREVLSALVLKQAPRLAPTEDWITVVSWGAEYHVLTYFCLLAVIHAFLYYDKLREREVKTSRLEAQLTMARLEVLKTQLHPHFLFNTLNAISALMHRDVDAADRMIALLSDLLRLSLDQDSRHQVPLNDELSFLDRYLRIERIRFRDRLRVEMDIEDECLSAQVPRLILQPLVENSVRHGLAMLSSAGQLGVRARRKGDRLILSVLDDGPGLPQDGIPEREGVGLANTRARLQQIYGDNHDFVLTNLDRGLEVRMEIPFEETPRFAVGSERAA